MFSIKPLLSFPLFLHQDITICQNLTWYFRQYFWESNSSIYRYVYRILFLPWTEQRLLCCVVEWADFPHLFFSTPWALCCTPLKKGGYAILSSIQILAFAYIFVLQRKFAHCWNTAKASLDWSCVWCLKILFLQMFSCRTVLWYCSLDWVLVPFPKSSSGFQGGISVLV